MVSARAIGKPLSLKVNTTQITIINLFCRVLDLLCHFLFGGGGSYSSDTVEKSKKLSLSCGKRIKERRNWSDFYHGHALVGL